MPGIDDSQGGGGGDIDPSILNVAQNLSDLDSEFQRMTKDADAILESIRQEDYEGKKSPMPSDDDDDDDDDSHDDDMSGEIERLDAVSDELRGALSGDKDTTTSPTKAAASPKAKKSAPKQKKTTYSSKAYQHKTPDLLREMERVGVVAKEQTQQQSHYSKTTPDPSIPKVASSECLVIHRQEELRKSDETAVSCQSTKSAAMTQYASGQLAATGLTPQQGLDELRNLSRYQDRHMVEYKPPARSRVVKQRKPDAWEEGVDIYIMLAFGAVWICLVVLLEHASSSHLLDERGMMVLPWPLR